MDSLVLPQLNAQLQGNPNLLAARDVNSQYLVLGILIGASCYQLVLCFLNTHIFAMSRGLVGVAEAAILLACTPLLLRRIQPGTVILILISAGVFCFLSLLSHLVDIKGFRDLLIPLWFFWLGTNFGRIELADKFLKIIIALVIVFAFFEFFFLDTYVTVFNIANYYVNIGNMMESTEYVRDSSLQLNGTRPEDIGRTLLPSLLGSHRVSSIFLEPVSLGNFATVLAAWGLSKPTAALRETVFFVGMAIVLIVLADSRFALLTVPMMVGIRLCLHGDAIKLLFFLPIFAVGLLVVLATLATGHGGDDYLGRLIISGYSLREFTLANILGIPNGYYYGDQGYAYVLTTFGLPLSLLLWIAFWLLPTPNETSERFRGFMALYITLILCISGNSLFAFKTSAIVWFLMGCALMQPAIKKTTQAMATHSFATGNLHNGH